MDQGLMYIQEYLQIVKFLINSGKVPVEKGYVLVTRKVLDQLLTKNGFETVENKLKIWSQLHWIDAEPGRYTRKVTRGGSSKRYVKIENSVYQTLQELFSEKRWEDKANIIYNNLPTEKAI